MQNNMTEDEIKALAEQARQKELAEQYLSIVKTCEELELALKNPKMRLSALFRADDCMHSIALYRKDEWPEICGKFGALLEKLKDQIDAEDAEDTERERERARLPWHKRIFS